MAKAKRGRGWELWPESMIHPISKAVPYERNPRTHPKVQIDMLAELLKTFGPDQPIVVDEDWIILKGHGRRLGALAAGIADFPMLQRTGLSAEEKTAIRIADNQSSLLSGWDQELIRGELGTLKTAGYEVELLGFPEAQLRGWSIGAGTNQTQDPEVIPEPPKKPVVRVGDVWILDKHRIICGDSTKTETWKVLFGDERASMMFTDAPYGVSYESSSGNFGVIEGDHGRSSLHQQ